MERCWDSTADAVQEEKLTGNTLNVKTGDAHIFGAKATWDSADTQYCPGAADLFGKDSTDSDTASFGQRLGGQGVFGPEFRPSERWVTQLALDTGLSALSAALETGLSELRGEIAKLHQHRGSLDRGFMVAGDSSVGPLTLLKLEVTQLQTQVSNMRRQLNCVQDWQNSAAAQPRAQQALDAVADLRADLEFVKNLDSATDTSESIALVGPMPDGNVLPTQRRCPQPHLPSNSSNLTAGPLLGVPTLPPNALDFTVQLDRGTPHGRPHAPLGITVDCADGSSLRVDDVGSGVVKAWNDANPTWAVRPRDRIIAVNGLAGDAARMMESAAQSERVELTIRRYPPPPPPLPADQQHLPPLEEEFADTASAM